MSKFRTPTLGQLTRFHRRNHRRAIVMDGEVGFTGGMAVSDVWLGHAQDPEHWRDAMFKVTGPLAKDLQAGFADTWVSSTGRGADGRGVYPARRRRPLVWSALFIWPTRRPTITRRWSILPVPILAARESVWLTTPVLHSRSASQRMPFRKRREQAWTYGWSCPGRNNDNKLERASCAPAVRRSAERGRQDL